MKYALSALLVLGLLSSWSLNAGAPVGEDNEFFPPLTAP